MIKFLFVPNVCIAIVFPAVRAGVEVNFISALAIGFKLFTNTRSSSLPSFYCIFPDKFKTIF